MSSKEGSLERLHVIPLIGKTLVLLTKKCWMTNSEEFLISVMDAEDVLIYVKVFQSLLIILMNQKDRELDSVSSDKFEDVVDACTLCDMCFLTKCPYVPPHEFNIDFPHFDVALQGSREKKK